MSAQPRYELTGGQDLGGQVTVGVPRAGYVLIDRDTDEGERVLDRRGAPGPLLCAVHMG
jgi:hypothetical protein